LGCNLSVCTALGHQEGHLRLTRCQPCMCTELVHPHLHQTRDQLAPVPSIETADDQAVLELEDGEAGEVYGVPGWRDSEARAEMSSACAPVYDGGRAVDDHELDIHAHVRH